MASVFKKRSKKTGLPPGTMVYIGDKPTQVPSLTVSSFTRDSVKQEKIDPYKFRRPSNWDSFIWVRMSGVSDIKAIETVGTEFKLHPLTCEDIVNTSQRPKIEHYDEYLYAVVRIVKPDSINSTLISEQVSFILGKGYIITFDEGNEDLFKDLHQRVTSNATNHPKGADYLLYIFLDYIVDNFFGTLERFGEQVEKIEEDVVYNQSQGILKSVYGSKRTLLALRRIAWPLREVIGGIERSDNSLVSSGVKFYFRDVYDHIIEIVDIIETMRDINTGMLDIYLSSANNRLNEVMKVLTVITTIFMPLTLLTGIYGMNFQNLPELKWEYGYPMVLAAMLVITVVMLAFFKRRRWI